eukprot:TRINITY_DN2049_c0_g1_i2.p1 TRINITY_DN2049_c0_g1~~TRINITY_DN2049_c0_g1_i2.p1  ORF type:complete len:970 (-),score=229.88 TRINITY_DN2049_c0_g1_i2:55-2883(-)
MSNQVRENNFQLNHDQNTDNQAQIYNLINLAEKQDTSQLQRIEQSSNVAVLNNISKNLQEDESQTSIQGNDKDQISNQNYHEHVQHAQYVGVQNAQDVAGGGGSETPQEIQEHDQSQNYPDFQNQSGNQQFMVKNKETTESSQYNNVDILENDQVSENMSSLEDQLSEFDEYVRSVQEKSTSQENVTEQENRANVEKTFSAMEAGKFLDEEFFGFEDDVQDLNVAEDSYVQEESLNEKEIPTSDFKHFVQDGSDRIENLSMEATEKPEKTGDQLQKSESKLEEEEEEEVVDLDNAIDMNEEIYSAGQVGYYLENHNLDSYDDQTSSEQIQSSSDGSFQSLESDEEEEEDFDEEEPTRKEEFLISHSDDEAIAQDVENVVQKQELEQQETIQQTQLDENDDKCSSFFSSKQDIERNQRNIDNLVWTGEQQQSNQKKTASQDTYKVSYTQEELLKIFASQGSSKASFSQEELLEIFGNSKESDEKREKVTDQNDNSNQNQTFSKDSTKPSNRISEKDSKEQLATNGSQEQQTEPTTVRQLQVNSWQKVVKTLETDQEFSDNTDKLQQDVPKSPKNEQENSDGSQELEEEDIISENFQKTLKLQKEDIEKQKQSTQKLMHIIKSKEGDDGSKEEEEEEEESDETGNGSWRKKNWIPREGIYDKPIDQLQKIYKAAGILPYMFDSRGQLKLLLGYYWVSMSKKTSPIIQTKFIGGKRSRKEKDSRITACREAAEETGGQIGKDDLFHLLNQNYWIQCGYYVLFLFKLDNFEDLPERFNEWKNKGGRIKQGEDTVALRWASYDDFVNQQQMNLPGHMITRVLATRTLSDRLIQIMEDYQMENNPQTNNAGGMSDVQFTPEELQFLRENSNMNRLRDRGGNLKERWSNLRERGGRSRRWERSRGRGRGKLGDEKNEKQTSQLGKQVPQDQKRVDMDAVLDSGKWEQIV